MFDRILLALDDSPAGEMAALFAGALARPTGASVHVLHVNQRVVGANGLTLRTRSEATELVTLAVQDLADSGVRASGSVRVSSYRSVPRQIVAVARERSADAIVLGSNRNRWLGRLYSSRVRDRTTRLTSLPLLTAPAPLKMRSTAGPAVAGERRLERVLDAFFR
jgi:nucleotide-binding universal stress UspA family protein